MTFIWKKIIKYDEKKSKSSRMLLSCIKIYTVERTIWFYALVV